jgi:hypothetical protein
MFAPLMRRVWRRRWDAVARAEFYRSMTWGTAASVGLVALLAWGGTVWALLGARDFVTASVIVRAIMFFTWLLAMGLTAAQISSKFLLDVRRDVNDCWLMTSAPRYVLLWSRTIGATCAGPLLVMLLAPLYVIGAAGLSGAQYGLFALGGVARAFTVTLPFEPDLRVGAAVALPLALLGMLGDVLTCYLAGCGALSSALRKVARKRLWKQTGRSLLQELVINLKSLTMGLGAVIPEAVFAGLAGLWCYRSWRWAPSVRAPAGLLVAVGLMLLAVAVRRAMMGPCVTIAAESYDDVMLEDSPLGGGAVEPDRWAPPAGRG